MKKEAGAPAIVNPRLDELRERAKGGKPPEPEVRKQCHVCNRGFFAPDLRSEPFTMQTPLGRRSRTQDGWHCDNCGVRVKFIPAWAVDVKGPEIH